MNYIHYILKLFIQMKKYVKGNIPPSPLPLDLPMASIVSIAAYIHTGCPDIYGLLARLLPIAQTYPSYFCLRTLHTDSILPLTTFINTKFVRYVLFLSNIFLRWNCIHTNYFHTTVGLRTWPRADRIAASGRSQTSQAERDWPALSPNRGR